MEFYDTDYSLTPDGTDLRERAYDAMLPLMREFAVIKGYTPCGVDRVVREAFTALMIDTNKELFGKRDSSMVYNNAFAMGAV